MIESPDAMKSFFLLLLLLMLVSLTAIAQDRGSFTYSYTEPGTGHLHTIRMWVPEEGSLDSMRPLIIAWHGAAMTAVEMRTMMTPIARELGAIVAAPEYWGLDQSSYDIMADSSIGYAMRHYSVDPARTISSGFSWGGGIAFKMGMLRPELFAGIITMSPAIDTMSITSTMWANLSRTRIGTILGSRDFYYKEVKAAMEEIDRRGGQLLFLEKPDVFHTDPYFSSAEFHDDYIRIFDFIVPATTSVGSVAGRTGALRLAPNPARDLVRLEWASAPGRRLSVDIVDRLGRTVKRHVVTSGASAAMIDISPLEEGVYLMVARADGELVHRTLVIAR